MNEADPYECQLPPIYNMAVIQPGVIIDLDAPYRELEEDQRARDDIEHDQRQADYAD